MSTTLYYYRLAASRLGIVLLLGAGAGCRRGAPVPEGILADARQEMQQADFATARDMLLKATAAQPYSVTAHVNLGLAYWQLGDLTAAAAAFNRATELAPNDSKAVWEMLGHLLIQSGNYEGAAEVLANIASPTDVTLTLKALAEQKAGNPEPALHYLTLALKQNRFYPPALYNLAKLHRDSLNAPPDALAAWKRFREADPQNPRAADSDDTFLKAGAIGTAPALPSEPPAPTPAPPVEPLPPPPEPLDNPPVGAPPAQPPQPEDKTVPAPAVIVRKTEPEPKPSPKTPVQTLIRKADAEISAGNNDAALVTLKNAVQAYPDNPDAVWALAVFYDKQLGLKDRADGLYQTFLNMFPADPRAAALLARQTVAAPPLTASKKTVDPVPDTNYFKQGLDHYARQEWDAAITAYRKALSLDPKSASCAYNLGLSYKAKNDLDAAAAAFRHALGIEPDMGKSLYMLGLTEIHRNRNADALTHLNRLISIQPDFAKAHYLLGTVYQNENRSDMAAFHFDRFLKLDPADSAAPQVRRWLEQHRR